MAIRRVTGAVSPSELIFADANALGATYDGSGTTIERGETFTLPAAGTTAVSNGALRLEALKGDCTITNNGNSTLTNASGVDGTIVMRSGASDFPAFVRNSSMGSMSTPAREDFTGSLIGAGTFDGTINSNATFPTGHVIQTVTNELAGAITTKPNSSNNSTNPTWTDVLSCNITPSSGTKCIVFVNTIIGSQTTGSTGYIWTRLLRDSTTLSPSDVSSYDWDSSDSPASTDTTHQYARSAFDTHGANGSTQVTYKFQISNQNASYNVYVGRGHSSEDLAYGSAQATRIIVMEIK